MDFLKYSNIFDKAAGTMERKECRTDNECRLTSIPDFNSLYCVNNLCIQLRGPGMPCYFPEECSSYGYYGPTACSSKCTGSKIECKLNYSGVTEANKFCCKRIVPLGECNINRPGQLSGCGHTQVCSILDGVPRCQDRKEKSWLLAVLCSISGNIFINIGVNLQKLSYKRNYVNAGGLFINTMVSGISIYALGKIIAFSAYIFGNQSLMAGLSATGLVSNSLFAPLINNEVFTWKDGAAILCAAVGSTMLINSTSHIHTIYTLCELVRMYYRPQTLAWFGFIIIMIFVLFFYIKFVEANSDWNIYGDSMNRLLRNSTIFFDEDSFTCRYVMVICYVWLSSFIASFTTLSIKSLGEIISKGLSGDKQSFYTHSTFFFLGCVILCTLLQIYWLNRALKRYDALLVVPIFHITWTILSIFTAGIYFQDFDHFSTSQFHSFIYALLVIFCGSIFLGLRVMNKQDVHTRRIEIPEEEMLN